jgi:hypothetical protein
MAIASHVDVGDDMFAMRTSASEGGADARELGELLCKLRMAVAGRFSSRRMAMTSPSPSRSTTNPVSMSSVSGTLRPASAGPVMAP